jgi:hypothetical protein
MHLVCLSNFSINFQTRSFFYLTGYLYNTYILYITNYVHIIWISIVDVFFIKLPVSELSSFCIYALPSYNLLQFSRYKLFILYDIYTFSKSVYNQDIISFNFLWEHHACLLQQMYE